MTESAVYLALSVSFLMLVSAEMQGGDKRTNTIKERAEAGVKSASSDTFEEEKSTKKADTADSFAIIPQISATAVCQLPNPSGVKSGARVLPKVASTLWEMSFAGVRFKVKCCKTQTETLVRKMTLEAFKTNPLHLSITESAVSRKLGKRYGGSSIRKSDCVFLKAVFLSTTPQKPAITKPKR